MRSSPRRFLLFSLAGLPCWLFPTAVYATTVPGKAMPPAAPPPAIVFYVATGGPNSCGQGCDQGIAADRTIDQRGVQTHRQLRRKLASPHAHVVPPLPRANT